jgi:hypothetical protein
MRSLWYAVGTLFLLITTTACYKIDKGTRSASVKVDSLPAQGASIPCNDAIEQGLLSGRMNGVSLVAPPNPFKADPVEALAQLDATWVALLPYAYFRKNQPAIHAFSKGGWWGERPEGIASSAQYAHQNGLKVMLKPQLWTHDQWIGNLAFDTEKEWQEFEQNYEDFILKWAVIGDSLGVELLCIGTELCKVVEQRPQFWKQLCPKIRQGFQGQLTYAPNWDSYQKVTFWDELDYIGVDAYFPLVKTQTPSVCELKAAWRPYVEQLKACSQKWDRPMLFTEYGYLSLDNCTYQTWELEKNRGSVNINEQAQANALEALLETFGHEDWWAGGFLWKWYPSYGSAMGEGKHARDYTPQGKQAEAVLEQLFEKQ